MATQAERRASMRARWIEVGTQLFSARGYERTSTGDLLTAAGASKGALYHHFPSKRALFEAVFETASEAAIARAISRAAADTAVEAGPPSALDRLIRTALAWLDEVSEPSVAKLLLEEGTRVLGFEGARDLEARTSLGIMIRSLEAAEAEGEIHVPDIPLMARLLNAVLAEAALAGGRGEDGASRENVEDSLRSLVGGLRR